MKFDKIILLGAAILAASPLPLEAKSRKGKGDVTVAVFSLNDFHGGFVRNDYKNIPGALPFGRRSTPSKAFIPTT